RSQLGVSRNRLESADGFAGLLRIKQRQTQLQISLVDGFDVALFQTASNRLDSFLALAVAQISFTQLDVSITVCRSARLLLESRQRFLVCDRIGFCKRQQTLFTILVWTCAENLFAEALIEDRLGVARKSKSHRKLSHLDVFGIFQQARGKLKSINLNILAVGTAAVSLHI